MLNQTDRRTYRSVSDVYMLTGQMFHIPVVLAVNYQAHGCPLVLMNFDARAGDGADRPPSGVSAFLGVTTMLNWMMADEKFRLATTSRQPAQHPVRRRPDAVAG